MSECVVFPTARLTWIKIVVLGIIPYYHFGWIPYLELSPANPGGRGLVFRNKRRLEAAPPGRPWARLPMRAAALAACVAHAIELGTGCGSFCQLEAKLVGANPSAVGMKE